MNSGPDIGERRIEFANSLTDPNAFPGEIVIREDLRVNQLLGEVYADPYAEQPRLVAIGRRALTRIGLLKPIPVQAVERPWLEEAQASRTRYIESQLDRSRKAIRDGVVFGVDDVIVDTYLGLREENSMLPPLFRRLHHEAEKQLGHDLSFLGWMADHATNEQLINVWQWHDAYLNKLDNDPGFKEKVATVKKNYLRGSEAAIEAKELHPSMRVSAETVEAVKIVHASPLSQYTATTLAIADPSGRILVGLTADEQDLFHEMTHATKVGLISTLGEGATEILTAVIYNRAHPPENTYDLEGSGYADQLAIHATLKRLTAGKLNTYELSRLCAGSDKGLNTAHLVLLVDDELGFPLLFHALKAADAFWSAFASRAGEIDLARLLGARLREQMSIIEDAYFDEQGNRIRHDAGSLLGRLVSAEMSQQHSQESIIHVIGILAEAMQTEAAMHENQ